MTPEQAALAIAARIAHALYPDGWGKRIAGPPWTSSPRIVPTTLAEAQAEWAAAQRCPKCGKPPRPGHDVAAAVGNVHCDPVTCIGFAGDPKRGPALSGRSADGRVTWSVCTGIGTEHAVRIEVGAPGSHSRNLAGMQRAINRTTWYPVTFSAEAADWTECVRIAAAADGGAP
jgi:hypothetical protein